MSIKEYIEKFRVAVVRCAKRNKEVRYIVIGIIAIYLFFYHLLRGSEKEWKQFMAVSISAVMIVTLTVHVQASVSNTEYSDNFETIESTDFYENIEGSESTEIEPNSPNHDDAESVSNGDITSTGENGDTQETESTEETGDIQETESTQVSGNDQATTTENPEESASDSLEESDSQVLDKNDSEESESDPSMESTDAENSDGDIPSDKKDPVSGEENDKDEESEMQQPVPVQVVSRNGGFYQEGIFFAGKNSWYEIKVDVVNNVSDGDMKNINILNYRLGDKDYTAEIVAGRANISIPENFSGDFVVFSPSNQQNNTDLCEYIISDQNSPIVRQAVIEKEGNYYLKLEISEEGENISGIKEYFWNLDNDLSVGNTVTPIITYEETAQGINLQKVMAFEILLTDFEEHVLKVNALDNAGNKTEESFHIRAGENDIISVVIPTKFDVIMYPDVNGQDGLVQSDDIIVCNKSQFPIDVNIHKAQVKIASEADASGILKKCRLNLGVLMSGQEAQSCELLEGKSENLLEFTLLESQTNTDAEELIRSANSGENIKKVLSPDYAAVKILGNMNYAAWENGDLSIKLIFNFKKSDNQQKLN